jgi:error-prone DNA polymerase
MFVLRAIPSITEFRALPVCDPMASDRSAFSRAGLADRSDTQLRSSIHNDRFSPAAPLISPDRFEAQRRTVLSSAMVGMKGRLQKEGIVTRVIIDQVIDYTELLRSIGGMSFPHRPGPGDGATHGGGPDPRDAKWPKSHDGYYPPFANGADPEDVIRVKSHDFH